MKTRIAATALGLAMLAGAPALAEPEAKPETKTALVSNQGQRVNALPLKYEFAAAWVVDTQRVLYLDSSRSYYLVTTEEACSPLGIKGRSVAFFPDAGWRLRETRSYELRPQAGQPCRVSQIAKLHASDAQHLRSDAMHRLWW